MRLLLLRGGRERPCGCSSADKCDELPSFHGAAPSRRDIHINKNLNGTGEVPLENSQRHLDVLSVSGDTLRDRDGVERARNFPRNAIAGSRLLLCKITAEPHFAVRKSLL